MEKKLKYIKLIVICILIITIVVLSYMIYNLKSRKHINIVSEKYFNITQANNTDLKNVAINWVEGYINQYTNNELDREMRLKNLNIFNVQVLDTDKNIVRVDFNIEKQKSNSKYFINNNFGSEKENVITCNWVITFTSATLDSSNKIWININRVRPAAYDLEKYNNSQEYINDKEYSDFMNKKKYEDKTKQNTYKIENGKVYVTYDTSKTWKLVNFNFSNIINNNTYKIEEGLFQISKEVTIISFSKGNEYIIAYSNDGANTWNSIKIEEQGSPMYIHFTNRNTGYVVMAGDVAMGQIQTTILKTTNAGASWKKVSEGVNGAVRRGSSFEFLNDNVGFILIPTADNSKSTLYRTEDGYNTFEAVEFPAQKFKEDLDETQEESEIKWNDVYDTPELPKYENNILTVVISQGSDGDYSGGTKASYKSMDLGKTWEFIEEFKPVSQPWEG